MIRGETTATLSDGRTLTLAMGFRALALAAASSGIPASDIFKVLRKDDGRQTLAVLSLIEGALKKYHREIGQDEIDDLMLTDPDPLTVAIFAAINGAFEDAKDSGEEDEGNAPNGTSMSSKGTGRKRA